MHFSPPEILQAVAVKGLNNVVKLNVKLNALKTVGGLTHKEQLP